MAQSSLKKSEHIKADPPAAIPGGEVAIVLRRSRPATLPDIWFGDRRAHLVASAAQRALALVPDLTGGGSVELGVSRQGESVRAQKPILFVVGRQLARGLHPVANPAFDPADDSLLVTRSGSRGEHVPVSIYRITTEGDVRELPVDITNPTAIAFDKRGQMFVTSRFDGSVYRITALNEVIEFSSELGIATGLAFDADGNMFVGDRAGRIFRVNEIGEAKPWGELEPSVSAYHLAFGPDRGLYVTGPTVSSFDSVTRFDSRGHASEFYRGLGRPQGMAFDRDGNLFVAASFQGRRGIVRISSDGASAELVVAGMNIVGLAFSARGEMVVATNEAVYSLPLGIQGTLLP